MHKKAPATTPRTSKEKIKFNLMHRSQTTYHYYNTKNNKKHPAPVKAENQGGDVNPLNIVKLQSKNVNIIYVFTMLKFCKNLNFFIKITRKPLTEKGLSVII